MWSLPQEDEASPIESKDRVGPHRGGHSLGSLGGQPGAQDCLGIVGPGQALSRVCSSLIAAQVGRLVELGAASGQATWPG